MGTELLWPYPTEQEPFLDLRLLRSSEMEGLGDGEIGPDKSSSHASTLTLRARKDARQPALQELGLNKWTELECS
jgi:hypothetical protein